MNRRRKHAKTAVFRSELGLNAAARDSVRALVLDAEARHTLTRTKMSVPSHVYVERITRGNAFVGIMIRCTKTIMLIESIISC